MSDSKTQTQQFQDIQKHTHEPWYSSPDRGTHVVVTFVGSGGKIVPLTIPDYDRAVLCVNALIGVEDVNGLFGALDAFLRFEQRTEFSEDDNVTRCSLLQNLIKSRRYMPPPPPQECGITVMGYKDGEQVICTCVQEAEHEGQHKDPRYNLTWDQ